MLGYTPQWSRYRLVAESVVDSACGTAVNVPQRTRGRLAADGPGGEAFDRIAI